MTDINNITVTGRLVSEPVLNHSASGNCLGSFTLASNYRFTNRLGEMRFETAYVPCKVFGVWAESLGQQRYGVCPRTIQNWSDAGLLVFIKKRRVVRYHVPGCDAALMQNGLQLN